MPNTEPVARNHAGAAIPKDLYYMAPEGKLMAVEVKATSESCEQGSPFPASVVTAV